MPLSKGRAVALSIYKAVRGLRRNKTSICYFIRLMREIPANLVDIDKSRNLNLVNIDKPRNLNLVDIDKLHNLNLVDIDKSRNLNLVDIDKLLIKHLVED